jgi:hypothetical protein
VADWVYDPPMRRLSSVTVVATAGWPDLVDELDRWQEAERAAALWWRDDDAVAPGDRLERVMSIAGNVPIALAVIPGAAEPALADWLARQIQARPEAGVTVLQHGWRHSNHAVRGKKSEFPAERRREDVASELAAGRARLGEFFGDRALPILVPPWNRLDDCFLTVLPDCGIHGISRMNSPPALRPASGLIEVNVHVDCVAWLRGRGFIGEGAALAGIVGQLRKRRLGRVCIDEPTGILTHHLVHDEKTETFLRRLLEVTGTHAAARWLDATEVFARALLEPA